MGSIKTAFILARRLWFAGVIALITPTTIFAADSNYSLPMKRVSPEEKISRDGILSAVKSKYKGHILSVQEKPLASYPDCHIIRMLSLEGEYMTIQVACSD